MSETKTQGTEPQQEERRLRAEDRRTNYAPAVININFQPYLRADVARSVVSSVKDDILSKSKEALRLLMMCQCPECNCTGEPPFDTETTCEFCSARNGLLS